jgi:hypothetical protein
LCWDGSSPLRREEWFCLPDHECDVSENNVAKKSFKFIPAHIENINELQDCFYHQGFTDVTKLQRAKNSTEKRISADFRESNLTKRSSGELCSERKKSEGQGNLKIQMRIISSLKSHPMFYRNVVYKVRIKYFKMISKFLLNDLD